jgi:hypothetical protein
LYPNPYKENDLENYQLLATSRVDYEHVTGSPKAENTENSMSTKSREVSIKEKQQFLFKIQQLKPVLKSDLRKVE